jgi:hypothetical protein
MTLSEAEAAKTRSAAHKEWLDSLDLGSMVFVIGDDEDAEAFEDEGEPWGATLQERPQKAARAVEGPAGGTKSGEHYASAKWLTLDRKEPDGSLVYDIPGGPAFPLPLATCLQVPTEDGDVTKTRRTHTVSCKLADKLREEMSAWR